MDGHCACGENSPPTTQMQEMSTKRFNIWKNNIASITTRDTQKRTTCSVLVRRYVAGNLFVDLPLVLRTKPLRSLTSF